MAARNSNNRAGGLMARTLQRVVRDNLQSNDVQDQINQELLDFLNTATAQMRVLLEKRSRLRRTPIKPPPAEEP